MSYLFVNLLGLIGLVGVFYLTGWLVDQLVMRGQGLEPIALVGRFGLGAAVWMGVLFALSALGFLDAASLGLLVMLTLVGVWRRRRSTGSELLPIRGELQRATGAWAGRLLGIGTAILLLVLWLQTVWPQISWDAAAYHLTIPRLYLEQGGFHRIPFNVYSNWPLNTQLLYAMAQMVGDHVLAKSLHFALGAATLLTIYRTVGSGSAKWVGWVGALLFLTNPVVLDEMRAAYVDLAHAFFFLLAFLFVHFALEDNAASRRQLVLAGVFAGVAAGIKPTGFVGVVCLLALFLVVSLRQRTPTGAIIAGLARILTPAALVLAPWVIKTWVLTGNPVYPFLFSVFGGPEWSPELGRQLRDWQQGMGMGRGWIDYLLLPYRVVVEGGGGYDRFDGRVLPVWLGLVPLALVMCRRQTLIARSLGIAGLYFVFWALSSQQMRFLIPVLPPLAIAGSLGLYELTRRGSATLALSVRWCTSVMLLVWLALIIGTQARSTGMMVRQYLEQGGAVRDSVVHPVFEFVNEQLPTDAKLMFLNTNHGFLCHREFIADSFFEASQINALLRREPGIEGVGRALRDLGVTHLLIENRDRYVPWPESLYDYLNDRSRTRPLMRTEDGVYDVVELVGGDS